MEDFELYRKDSHILATKAINIGAICTSNTTDSLLQIRTTINLLISVNFLSDYKFYLSADDSAVLYFSKIPLDTT